MVTLNFKVSNEPGSRKGIVAGRWTFGLESPATYDSLAYSVGAIRADRRPDRRLRGWIRLAEVRLQDGESIESALRRFKRKVQQEDIIKDIRKHAYYLKPGDKRRAKQALARKRNRKKQRREVE